MIDKEEIKIKNAEEKNENVNTKRKPIKETTTNEKNPKKKMVSIFVRILLVFFIIVFIFSVFRIVKYVIDSKENKQIFEEITSSVIQEDMPELPIVNFAELKEKNSDTVGWLEVPNTEVKFPVVKSADNDFYLNHNFYKDYNAAGWIFMDCANVLDGTDKNIVIYGHNRKDGTMFGTLKNILKNEWLNNEENKEITFMQDSENAKYEVFSVYQIEVEDYYRTTNFKEGEFEKFIETIKSRSVKDFGVDVSNEDQILTLSTCGKNNTYRIVLHAKKIAIK